MALLYDPGHFMPRLEHEFSHASWMMGWPDGTWCLHDLEPGGTVYLVSTASQRIVWQTRVTQSFAVPYERVDDLRDEVLRRWGLRIDVGTLPTSGYCVGWRATPVARLDRTLAPDPLGTTSEDLSLDGFQFTIDESPQFRRRWDLPAEEPHWCTGRPRLGWFGA